MTMVYAHLALSPEGAVALPALARYLAALPNGLHSFPGCDTTVSLCQVLRNVYPAEFKHPLLPKALRDKINAPWREGDFIPIALQVIVFLLLQDCLKLDAQALSDIVCAQTQVVFDKPGYRLLFRLLSPSLVIMGGAMRWNRDFRGVPLRVKLDSPGRASGEFTYPKGLVTSDYRVALGGIFRAALEKSRGTEVACNIYEKIPGKAEFQLHWATA